MSAALVNVVLVLAGLLLAGLGWLGRRRGVADVHRNDLIWSGLTGTEPPQEPAGRRLLNVRRPALTRRGPL